ncbi:hypothetical protein DSCO28_21730 [Desulfosarcina ovata subsp. sediminis]|uniref:Ketosynthase family 3 (KS3) domain-containing protein n=1 Tax=Desulfosarcina ovata subsp. sediminis TaxID=885957 RepID=A0A5K7ZN05_9BACT|nr:beta-ketoacyl synthase N-terminal-like domain-containing protein [Desulfosarcina ovata]BBO81607.1 hypothetical protein DSCO28_21730 [Desulfosarcina ovata subsp. sediminis]
MTDSPVFIVSMGMISKLGSDSAESALTLRHNTGRFTPLTLFDAGPDGPLPVAELPDLPVVSDPPRTHQLARIAADQAMAACIEPPEAIVLGTTTGGMPATEIALEKGIDDPGAFRHHGVGTVAEDLARRYGCNGALITLSTACASGATAIAVAAAMIRQKIVRRVLAGGADALCQLTYFGFKSLQVIDPAGARPLDRDRRGMSLGEGAAMLLLSDRPRTKDDLQLLGAGLSCDAHHPSTPHPEGAGALAAMQAALADAGLRPEQIDAINLHGTGTPDNDRAEALAVNTLFDGSPPPLSSTKGFTGHTLGSAGALEAGIACLSIQNGVVPANVGTQTVDPALRLSPVASATSLSVGTVLSNSFGFGGNNAALVVGKPRVDRSGPGGSPARPLIVTGYACLSGSGRTAETLAALSARDTCQGCLSEPVICRDLNPRSVRRLKRLSKIALALAEELRQDVAASDRPQVISMGTGWGALSETSDFIGRLQASGYQFPSPMDFIGSVHNAPAGQVAMLMAAKGANLTASGGDYSFEQALVSADLVTRGSTVPMLVMGTDEAHATLSPLFDPSVAGQPTLSDGGGAILLRRGEAAEGVRIALAGYRSHRQPNAIEATIASLGGADALNDRFGAILAGMPAAHRALAMEQLDRFVMQSGFSGPIIDFRPLTGEFATATAIAAVAGIHWVNTGTCAAGEAGGHPVNLDGKGVLLLGLGRFITATSICAP